MDGKAEGGREGGKMRDEDRWRRVRRSIARRAKRTAISA